jgi:hypothetical protein
VFLPLAVCCLSFTIDRLPFTGEAQTSYNSCKFPLFGGSLQDFLLGIISNYIHHQTFIQMTKVNFNLRNIAAIAVCLAATTVFLGCDPSENEPKAIEITNEQALTQEVFAGETKGKSGVQITTTGAWTSRIEDAETLRATTSNTPELRAETTPDWISISPDHGDKAGNYTIQITLAPNISGANRSAVIRIICGDTEITISVTQKNVTEDGKPLTTQDLLLAHPWRLIKQIYSYPESPEDNFEKTMNEVISFSADGKIIGDSLQTNSLQNLTYTLSENNIILGDSLITCDITKLTDHDLEFIGKTTETWETVDNEIRTLLVILSWIFVKP